MLTDLRDEVDRLSTMVGDLLLLARADSGAVEMTSGNVDLAALATMVLADLQPIAAAREKGQTSVVQYLEAKATTAPESKPRGRGLIDGGLGVSDAMNLASCGSPMRSFVQRTRNS